MIVIATSDKGGTGRSVTGSNVIYRRALQGSDVCYVDFDFGSPTAGAIFGISALTRGTTTGNGTHSYLLGRSPTEELLGRLAALRPARPPPAAARDRTARPGSRRRQAAASSPPTTAVVDRCIDLFLRLHSEFEVVLVDLSAGRSYAAEIVIAATVVTGADQRDHAVAGVPSLDPAAHPGRARPGLRRTGLLDIGEAHGRDRDQFIDDIRFVRTAIVDPNAPDLAGLRPEQLAWLREANRGLQQLAAERRRGPVHHARRGAA